VNVRMMLQLLSPSMKHAEEADFRSQPFGISSDFYQRFSAEAKQHRVDELLVLQCELRQKRGNREDNMRIWNRKKFFLPSIDPTTAGVGLAFWAVSIKTRVVRVAGISAFRIRAFIQVIAEIGCTTALDRSQNFQMLSRDPVAAIFDEALSNSADNIGHLDWWPVHLFVRIGCFIWKQSIERTNGGAQMQF
jgi:hypothetical protein